MSQKIFKIKTKAGFLYLSLRDGAVAALGQDPPTFIEIFPALECNVDCPLCDRGREKSVLENFNDIKTLYQNLSSDSDFCFSHFRISGKEPTLYRRINELVAFLHGLDPKAGIRFFTNALKLNRLTIKSLSLIELYASIYGNTKDILAQNQRIKNILESKGVALAVNVFRHEDLKSPGTKRAEDFDPLRLCFGATLVCGTRKVYPCCRAHVFEQMYKKKYHYFNDAKNLYQKLKRIIRETDLCRHCPRLYQDCLCVPR